MKPSAPALATAATSSARPDPLHAALHDRVLDAEQFGEPGLQHGSSPLSVVSYPGSPSGRRRRRRVRLAAAGPPKTSAPGRAASRRCGRGGRRRRNRDGRRAPDLRGAACIVRRMVRLQRLVLCCLLMFSVLSQGIAMAGMTARGHVHADGGPGHASEKPRAPGRLNGLPDGQSQGQPHEQSHGQPHGPSRGPSHGQHEHHGSSHAAAPCPAHAAAPDCAAARDGAARAAIVDPAAEHNGCFASCADPDHQASATPGCSGGAACCIGAGLLLAAVAPGDGAAARAAAGPPCALPLSFSADRIERPPQTSPIGIAIRA